MLLSPEVFTELAEDIRAADREYSWVPDKLFGRADRTSPLDVKYPPVVASSDVSNPNSGCSGMMKARHGSTHVGEIWMRAPHCFPRPRGEPHRTNPYNVDWIGVVIVDGDRPNIPGGDRTPPYGGAKSADGAPANSVSTIPAALARLAEAPWWPSQNLTFLGNGKHHRSVTSWYDLAGRVLQSWPVTLRIAVLLLVVLTGTAEIAAKIGLSGQTIAIALDAWYYARRRYRQS